MKREHKRALSLFLAFLMVFTSVPGMPAFAKTTARAVFNGVDKIVVTDSRATPSDATPSDGTPSDGTPSDGTPSDSTPSDGTPSDGTPSDGTPSDATPSEPDDTVLVKSIEINGETKVGVEKKIELVANASPSNASNKDLTWTLDILEGENPAVLDLSDNKVFVIGKEIGKVKVTAAATDGSDIKGTLEITVVDDEKPEKPDPLEPVISITGESVVTKDAPIELTATASPSDAFPENINWKWSIEGDAAKMDSKEGSDVATITGVIVGGQVTVTASATDLAGKEFKGTLVIDVVAKEDSSVSEQLGALKDAIEDAIKTGDKKVIVAAVDSAIAAVKDIYTIDNITLESMGMMKELEETIIRAMGWGATERPDSETAPVSVNEVVGAALNISTTLENVNAKLAAAEANIADLPVPGKPKNAVAFDLSLGIEDINGEVDPLNELDIPVCMTMEIPEKLKGVENMVLYNFHNGVRTPVTIISGPNEDNTITFVVDKFSPFVLADVEQSTDNGNGGGSSSSGSNSGSSIKASAGLTGQWIQDANGWWFKKTDNSYPMDTWAMINGKWYHFDAAGYMQIGWLLSGGRWYYLQPQGDMAVSTWILDKDNWYYIHSDGCMLSGQWLNYKSNWYYLNNDGSMMKNTVTPDGYTVNADGIYVK